MRRRGGSFPAVVIWAVSAVVPFSACSSRGTPEVPEVAAVVENSPIHASETTALLENAVERGEGEGLLKAVGRGRLAREVLSFQIKVRLLDQLAKEVGVSASENGEVLTTLLEKSGAEELGVRPVDLAQGIHSGRLSRAIAAKLFPDVAVTDAELEDEYLRREPALETLWKASADVAVFDSQEAANEVRRRAQGGEPLLAVAAGAGGRTAPIEISSISPLPHDLLSAAAQLPPGQISEPVHLGGAWLILMLRDRQDLPKPGLDAARPHLVEVVEDAKRRSLFRDWFDKQLGAAHITVDSHYGHWDAPSKSVME